MAGTFTQLYVHFIFSTKHREPLITDDLRDELFKYMGGIIRNQKGSALEINGMPDHVHVAAKLHPTSSPSDVMRLVKANSSKWVNERPDFSRSFAWQDGFGAFGVSKSALPDVIQYIQNQQNHHRHKTFQEEFLEFLMRHEIDYDPKFIWE